MTWITWLLIAFTLTAMLLTAAFLLTRRLRQREPYRSVLGLRTRQKLRLFKALVRDRRVPKLVRALPFLLALYLVTPIDIAPDFIPVLGKLDDMAMVVLTLALMVRLTPIALIEEHMKRLETNEAQ